MRYENQPIALKYATFNYECNEDGEFLTGNLWRYAPKLKEFIQPAVLVLAKTATKAGKGNEGKHGRRAEAGDEILDSSSVVIYPNPFSYSFTVKFSLAKPVQLAVSIYSNMGALVYSRPAKSYSAGEHTETLSLSPAPGIYTLYISGAGVNYLTQIIKN